jgi:hypothetical protein
VKTWKLFIAVVLAGVAVFMMTSMVVAAPASANGVQTHRVYADPLDPVLTDTLPMTHPVAAIIAFYFNIPYTQVMALHDAGFGFGTIARAYLTAQQLNGALTPEQILAMRQAGTGWGQMKKEYGIHPGGNGLGTIVRQHGTPQPPAPQPPAQSPNVPPDGNKKGKEDKGGNPGSAACPGNSCNAPGHTKSGQGPKK